MKVLRILSLLSFVMALMMGCSKGDLGINNQELSDPHITGNLAPSGPHFNLNIIGVSKEKENMEATASGHVILVPLEGRCKILLTEGEYAVLDKNATDGEGAFQLPDPDPENDGVTVYSVWARALGKPLGSASMVTGAIDPETGEVVYSMYTLEVERTYGKQRFQDVSRYLLYIYIGSDLYNDDGVLVIEAGRYPLFSDELQDYFWEYTNTGLKLLQLRFYEVPVTVPEN